MSTVLVDADVFDRMLAMEAVVGAARALCCGWTPRSYWLDPELERLRTAVREYDSVQPGLSPEETK